MCSVRTDCCERPCRPCPRWSLNLPPRLPRPPAPMYDTNGQRGGNANAPPPPDKYGALREVGKNVQGRLSAVVAKLQGKDTQIYTEMNSCPPKPLQVTEARARVWFCVLGGDVRCVSLSLRCFQPTFLSQLHIYICTLSAQFTGNNNNHIDHLQRDSIYSSGGVFTDGFF